jgi:hypothetical protein
MSVKRGTNDGPDLGDLVIILPAGTLSVLRDRLESDGSLRQRDASPTPSLSQTATSSGASPIPDPTKTKGGELMPNNQERMGWAREAVEAYCKVTRHRELLEYVSDPSDGEEVIADLLFDLRHLADSLHVDWTLAATRAARHYGAELKDEDGFAMDPDPAVYVSVHDGLAEVMTHGNVRVVHVDWDGFENEADYSIADAVGVLDCLVTLPDEGDMARWRATAIGSMARSSSAGPRRSRPMSDRTSMSAIVYFDREPTAEERKRFAEISDSYDGEDWNLRRP